MALDRIINFDRRPSPKIVEQVVTSFFGEWPGVIKLDRTSLFVDIPGKPSNPVYREERFIEIYLGVDAINVMTRQADNLVNSIADGLAKYLANVMDGRLEE